jgi:hypothetical protein
MSENTESTNVSMNIESKPDDTTPQIPPPVNITIPFVLLSNLNNIIVAAGDRGTFKTVEMYDVGRVYNEMRGYLTQHLQTSNSTENTNTNESVEASSLPEPEMASN